MSSPTDAAVRARRFAQLSRLLSWLAVLAGLGLVLLFLAQAGFFALLTPGDEGPVVTLPNPDQITATESTVIGLDRENQPYEVTARRGWQDARTPTLVHLEAVAGRFRKASGAEYMLSAGSGTYDTQAKVLDLAGDVTIVEMDRFTARMDRARVVVEEKRLTSDAAVTVTAATGTIRANGIEISDDGGRILFLNGVKAEFGGAPAKGDAQP